MLKVYHTEMDIEVVIDSAAALAADAALATQIDALGAQSAVVRGAKVAVATFAGWFRY